VTIDPIDPVRAAEWGVSALIALAAAIAALRWFKLGPIWAVVIGMAVFTGLQFPIRTHAVMLEMPLPKSN
jgi:hypothetical protein